MPSSGIFPTSNQYIVFWIEVIQNSQNINNNTSNVTVKVWIKRTNTGYTTHGSGTVYTNIDGVQRNVSITPSQKITSTAITIFHQDITVVHNSNGTKSLNVQVGISHDRFHSSQSTVSYNYALSTIPRASSFTLSASAIEAGKSVTLNISRASSGFTHNTYLIFGETFTIQNGVATSATGTIPLDVLNQIPNSATDRGTVYCDTYSGGTKIGTSSKSITITAPSNIVPTYSSLNITRVDNVVPPSWGIYVRGKSKATIEIVGAAGIYGSKISKYDISGDGQSGTSSKLTTEVLNNSGTVTFKGVITDSRGRTASKSVSITVVDYDTPKITDFTVQRCTKEGVLNDEGTYVKITPKWVYSSVNSKNTISAKVDYKTTSATSWGTATTVTTSGSSYIIGGGSISADTTYDVRLTVSDVFDTVSKTVTIPTAKTTLDFKSGGTGIAIGKVCERDGLEVDWDASFLKKLTVKGVLTVENDATVTKKLTVKGGLAVEDSVTITKKLTVNDSLTVVKGVIANTIQCTNINGMHLGHSPAQGGSASNLNTLTSSGWFCWGDTCVGRPTTWGVCWNVYANPNDMYQLALGANGAFFVRAKINGTWKAWRTISGAY